MKNKLLILVMMLLIIMLGLVMPSVSQTEWPDECDIVYLGGLITDANEAKASGNMVDFINNVSSVNGHAEQIVVRCLEEVAANGISVSEMNLQGANLAHYSWTETNLQGINMADVDLFDANLHRVNLQGANLQGAILHSANLASANLENANLQNVTTCMGYDVYHTVNLQYANLANADLRGADLEGAGLLRAQLTGAIFDESTKLPG